MRRGTTVCLIFFLMFIAVLHSSASAAEKAFVTRNFFENLDKESSLRDIAEKAGNYSIEQFSPVPRSTSIR